jgi:hypothetical protein
MARAFRHRHRDGERRHSLISSTVGVLLCVCLVGLVSTPASARPRLRDRLGMAAKFIVSRQEPDGSFPALSTDPITWTADAIVTLAAVGRGPRATGRAVEYLEKSSDEIDSIGEISKVVLAWLAIGRDPRRFLGRDLVVELEASQDGEGRYGSRTTVFSHSLAMLALAGAQATRTLDAAARWLVEAQCDNGGWQFESPRNDLEDEHCSLGYPDIDEANTDTTSLAVQALYALPTPVQTRHDPFVFLDSLWDPANGGWTYDRSTSFHSNFTSSYANANSTGMVLQAYAAADIDPPSGSRAALARLQEPLCGEGAGAFSYTWADEDGDGVYQRSGPQNLAATIAAVPGLLGAALPQVFAGRRARPRLEVCPK